MKIVELKTTESLGRIYPLIKQQNPWMTKARFAAALKDMTGKNYRCIAAVEGAKILGIAGFWQATRFWCGRYIEPDNVVVDKKYRSKGIGRKLMRWIEAEARRQKCEMVWLAGYTHSHAVHRFYLRERYNIKGFVFAKEMKGK